MKKNPMTLIICFCLTVIASGARAEESLQVNPFPDRIAIDTFYFGSTVSISGMLPQGCDAVVRIMGESGDLKMKRKGKVFGLLWMNRDTVTFQSVPGAFLLTTPGGFETLLNGRQQDAPVWEIGLTALQNRIRVSPDSSEQKSLIQDLMKLKAEEGIYAIHTGIRYTPLSGDQKKFETDLTIPPKLPPGSYVVEVYAVRGGDIVSRYQHPLTLKLESFPGIMSTMAFDHSAMYGILATLIAVVAGLLTGVFFGGSRGGH
ncbi:MAG: TIGR02186 family protein [Desulfatirhabdiaceae bacterium]